MTTDPSGFESVIEERTRRRQAEEEVNGSSIRYRIVRNTSSNASTSADQTSTNAANNAETVKPTATEGANKAAPVVGQTTPQIASDTSAAKDGEQQGKEIKLDPKTPEDPNNEEQFTLQAGRHEDGVRTTDGGSKADDKANGIRRRGNQDGQLTPPAPPVVPGKKPESPLAGRGLFPGQPGGLPPLPTPEGGAGPIPTMGEINIARPWGGWRPAGAFDGNQCFPGDFSAPPSLTPAQKGGLGAGVLLFFVILFSPVGA